MWSRTEIKGRARTAFKRNYWPCVLIALILALLVYNSNVNINKQPTDEQKTVMQDAGLEDLLNDYESGTTVTENYSWPNIFSYVPSAAGSLLSLSFGLAAAIMLLNIFVFNIIEIGGAGFFNRNREEKAQIGELLSAFSGDNYLSSVLTMFIRDIKLILWTLLLIVPGIIKYYEYMMIPYILSEHPETSRQDAFRMSREMMHGNKFAAFVLDLSFIGWYLLSWITMGIAGVLWTNPYVYAAKAELYGALKPCGADNETSGNAQDSFYY